MQTSPTFSLSLRRIPMLSRKLIRISPRRVLLHTLAWAMLCVSLVGVAKAAEECATIHEVVITHVFEPRGIEIEAGDCIRFINVHSIEHSAVGLQREFNTGTLLPGGTSVIPFEKPAAIPYWCGLHPPMQGNIIVNPR